MFLLCLVPSFFTFDLQFSNSNYDDFIFTHSPSIILYNTAYDIKKPKEICQKILIIKYVKNFTVSSIFQIF